ncbi:MAG: PKD domain-containing protein, partial [Planctomycetota bacterium]
MKKTILVAFSLVLATAAAAPAVTRLVPDEYATIQAAIDDCNDGDIVIVEAGTYSEAINFNGKNIVVSSTDPNDPDTVAATVIALAERAPGRGSGPARPEGSVVTFANGEGPEAVLSGFTITGGYGMLDTTLTDEIPVFWGAGIYCNNASPTITRNVITGNSGPLEMGGEDPAQWQLGYGAGIGGVGSSPLITHNIIKDNTAYAGAGIFVFGEPMISNNLVYGNSAVVGGGVVMLGGHLTNNTLVANNANLNGEDGVGGSIYTEFQPESSQPLILNNIVCNAKSGGGIFFEGAEEDSIAFNNVWNNAPGNYGMADPTRSTWIYDGLADRTGINGNISRDPLFVGPAGNDYHLQPDSPCVNAGDPAFVPLPGETDIDGQARVHALIVDVGADEYVGYVKPRADAGPDQHVERPELITLDGSGSRIYEPSGVMTFEWTQVGGPPVTLSDPTGIRPTFMPGSEGEYRFELVVSDGTGASDPDEVLIAVYNRPPVADAGPDQSMSSLPPIVTLDGSGSYDPTDDPLTYRWTQVSGPVVELSDPNAAETSFSPVETGVYVFSLVVSDDLADSEADTVGIVVGNTAPVARAGSSRYAATDPVVLDGTGSYDPDGYGVLSYQWTQVSGATVSIADADTATPTVGGFVQTSSIWECEFQLVVSDGDMNSPPDTVEVIIVPSFGTIGLVLENPPFDPNKPTFIYFSGGNGGSRLGVGRPWTDRANIISFNTKHRGTNLPQHGDAIIVYLSSVAPDYKQRIQTSGFSKGGKLPIGVGAHLNTTYLDAPGPTILDIPEFMNTCVDGEQSWVDNYRAGPNSAYPGREPHGALTVYFPLGDHGTPISWYFDSISPEYENWIGDFYNNGITAGAYYSVAGPGKNLELAPHTDSFRYYYEWEWPLLSPAPLKFYNESLYPGRVPELPTLVGPADGNTVDANGVVLSCQVCQNVVGYQLLMGPNPHDLKYVISD